MIQEQVLNKILSSKSLDIVTLNNLTEDYFSDFKDEFSYILDHVNSYGSVPDIESFCFKFNNFIRLNVSEPDEYLLSELVKDRKNRVLCDSFNEIKKKLLHNDVDAALEVYTAAFDTLNQSAGIKSVDIIKDITRYDDYVKRTEDFGSYYISTGFPELDRVIGGWDRTEELATIVARTNYGKTWILLKCATAAFQQGLKVGMYSGEMSERKVGYRFDTLYGHIANGHLTHGNSDIKTQYERYINELTKSDGSFKVITPKMINGPAGVRALKAFIEKEKLDILFIDQHSLLEDDRHGKSATEKAANISKDLKNLQVMVGIPIISVSQQNREKKDDGATVGTELIAQSDRIGQDSTVVLFLEKKKEEMTLTLVKSRDSENGKVFKYVTDLNNGYFTYIPDGEDENDSKIVNDLKNTYESVVE